jgi:hypothetical protein
MNKLNSKLATRLLALPLDCKFSRECLQLAKAIRHANPGDLLWVEIFETGEPSHESVLMCHDIIAQRPKGVHIHIHSHSKLTNAPVLVWLAADTRTLRSDAWIYFPPELKPEYHKFVPADVIEAMQERGEPIDFKADSMNSVQIAKHVRKYLPENLLGRPVWTSELEEFGLIEKAEAKRRHQTIQSTPGVQQKEPYIGIYIPHRLILPPGDPSLN